MKKSARGFRGKYFTIAGMCALHTEVKLHSANTSLKSVGFKQLFLDNSEDEVDPPDEELLQETTTQEPDSLKPP